MAVQNPVALPALFQSAQPQAVYANTPVPLPPAANLTLEEKILAFIRSSNGQPVKTIDIAKHVMNNPKATRKDVNPTLYKMSSMGLIVKTANADQTDPKWSLKTT
jgi:hypothetical protein